MGLDELRARLDSLLANQEATPDRRAAASGLHAAMVEFKVAAGQSRDALAAAERELASERRQLEDAARRGGLAAGIGDAETARIAEEFTGRHRERSELLERKVAVIRDELAYLEREYQALAARYQSARQGGEAGAPPPAADRPEREFDALKAKSNRETAELAVKAQLDLLKKKLGKQ
jgi:hypothetical protein